MKKKSGKSSIYIYICSVIIVFLFVFTIYNFTVRAVGVRPLVIDLEVSPGENEEFELQLSSEKSQEDVQLSLYKPSQREDGSLEYEKMDSDNNSISDWLSLETKKVTIPPREEKTLKGEVSVPHEARGTETIVVMVKPVVEENESGITFQTQYAVRINIHVDHYELRETIDVLDFGLESDQQGRPWVVAKLKNDSQVLYNTAAEVTIRDEERQLLERVKLNSPAAKKAGRSKTRLFPGSEVKFSGLITEQLPAGNYDLQLFINFAQDRQEIVRETVNPGDKFADSETLEYIEVEPKNITDSLKPGETLTEPLNIRNRTGEPVKVVLQNKEIEPEYFRSLFEHLDVQLRGNNELELDGRRSGQSVLMVKSSRESEIEDGGYYGKMQLGVFDNQGNHLETKEIDLDIITGEKKDLKAQILDFDYSQDKEEYIFSASIKNESNCHIAPRSRVYLRDESGEIQYTLNLNLPQGKEKILPQMKSHLITSVEDIKPGEYTAEIKLDYEQQTIAETEIPMEITNNRED
ncbi:MAG: WxL protein peptidoglycan domain-containing protein [Halanaerobiales bacterium]